MRADPDPLVEVARQAAELAPVALDMPLRAARRGAFSTSCDADADPGLIRHGQLLGARAPQHGEALGVRVVGGVARQARLADPRLAGEQHHLALVRARASFIASSSAARSSTRPT